jgi:uncharacterized membrane protein
MEFFEKYFLDPIENKTGYNIINTSVYAAIALISIYLIWKFSKGKIKFSEKEFLYSLAVFVLLGSTARVITDLEDSGFLKTSGLPEIYKIVANVFKYSYLTVTPGIYIVTSVLFFVALFLAKKLNRPYFAFFSGAFLWGILTLLILPFIRYIEFGLLVLAFSFFFFLLAKYFLEKVLYIKLNIHHKLAVFGQTLDGAATFVTLDFFSKFTGHNYFEQHVIPNILGTATPLGFGLFLLVKVIIASLMVYLIEKEGDLDLEDKSLFLLVIAVMGFAPGIRDLLRMLCGA